MSHIVSSIYISEVIETYLSIQPCGGLELIWVINQQSSSIMHLI
jgi:hypothetical protein